MENVRDYDSNDAAEDVSGDGSQHGEPHTSTGKADITQPYVLKTCLTNIYFLFQPRCNSYMSPIFINLHFYNF